jgi:hypothetical protein
MFAESDLQREMGVDVEPLLLYQEGRRTGKFVAND